MNQNRQHTRFDYATEVELEIETVRQPGTTVNISQGGALITTSPAIAFGTRLTLHIQLPGVKDISLIPGIVRWSKDGEGIGIQFETLRAIEVWAINRLKRS